MAAAALGGLCLGGCDAPRYEAVASQAISGGAVAIWVAEGRLETGRNRIVVDFTGEVAGRLSIPPRLRFRKAVSGSGYALEREVRLNRSGPGQFAGTIDFPEPGPWQGRLEVGRETVAIEVEVGAPTRLRETTE